MLFIRYNVFNNRKVCTNSRRETYLKYSYSFLNQFSHATLKVKKINEKKEKKI